MRAPAGFDPDMKTVIEIIQHAGEIVSRMPLAMLKDHLRQVREDDPAGPWYTTTIRMVESAQLLELDTGRLSALEARTEIKIDTDTSDRSRGIPDDWTMR